MIGTKFDKPLQPNRIHPYVPEEIEVEKTRTVTKLERREVVDPETGDTSIYAEPVEHEETYTEKEPNPEWEQMIDNPAPNTLKAYAEAAEWCNENGCHIEDKGEYYEIVENAQPSAEQLKQARITELKRQLAATDYAVIKIAEGEATPERYAEVLANRKAWRTEINTLEGAA